MCCHSKTLNYAWNDVIIIFVYFVSCISRPMCAGELGLKTIFTSTLLFLS